MDPSLDPTPPRRSPLLSALEALLWAASLALFAVVAWRLAGAAHFQATAREALRAASAVSEPAPTRTRAPAAPARLAEGTPLGILSIPRLDLSVVVAEGDSPEVLDRAVGRLPWSARPGEAGNLVLAGHRDTFFAPLAEVRQGDEIVMETERGEARYRVDWTAVVDPTDVSLAAKSDGPALTLVTCYPFRYVGPAPRRFLVRARPIDASFETG